MTEEDWTRPVRRATRCHGSEFMTSRKQSDSSKHRIKARAAQLWSQGTLFTTTLTAFSTKNMFFCLILIQSFYLFSEIRFFFSSLQNLILQRCSWKSNTTLGWTINARLSWNQKVLYQAHNSVAASDASSPQPHTPLNLLFNFNIIYPSTSMSTKWASLHVLVSELHTHFLPHPYMLHYPPTSTSFMRPGSRNMAAQWPQVYTDPRQLISTRILSTQPAYWQTEFPSMARTMAVHTCSLSPCCFLPISPLYTTKFNI